MPKKEQYECLRSPNLPLCQPLDFTFHKAVLPFHQAVQPPLGANYLASLVYSAIAQ